jgi:hypothetical protein
VYSISLALKYKVGLQPVKKIFRVIIKRGSSNWSMNNGIELLSRILQVGAMRCDTMVLARNLLKYL